MGVIGGRKKKKAAKNKKNMVAPHNSGQLIGSFVRIPGSGMSSNKTSQIDLGNISTFAASVPVHPLPSNLVVVQPRGGIRAQHRRTEKKKEEKNEEKKMEGEEQKDGKKKRDTTQEEAAAPHPKKRQRFGGGGDDDGETGTTVAAATVTTTTGHSPIDKIKNDVDRTAHPHPSYSSSLSSSSSSSAATVVSQQQHNHHHYQDLLQQLTFLRRENAELKRKISLFQQLFKNKKRLASVAKRLGLRIVEV